MGLFGIVWKVVAAVVLLVVGLGAYLYFTDYEAKATVTDRSAQCPPGLVEVTPRILPTLRQNVELSCDVWRVVCVGFDVGYHLQTKRTIVKDGDRVLYDSATGEKDVAGLAQCGASNSGGGLLGA